MRISFRTLVPVLLATVALSACYDDDKQDGEDGTLPVETTTVSGIAATGAAISGGAVALHCGNGFNTSTTSAGDGAWTASVPGDDLPCAVQVSGGTVNGVANTATFYSIALAGSGTASTANLTPVGDLALASAVNGAAGTALETWFATASDAQRQQVADGLAAAITALNTAFTAAGYTLPEDFNPFTAAITAGGAGDVYDLLLEAYKQALADAGKTYEGARGDYTQGSTLPAAVTETTGPTGPEATSLPDATLGVAFSAQAGAQLWLQPEGAGGVGLISSEGNGSIDVSMGDGREDGRLSISRLPNKLGTYACGDAAASVGTVQMEVIYGALGDRDSPRNTYVSYQDTADPSQRTLLPGYSCSVTLTHVGAFVLHPDGDRYIYNDDYVEGTLTAKLRQAYANCAGEGNCSPYKEVTISAGKFRINKSGRFVEVEQPPEPTVAKNLLGRTLETVMAGDYSLKCYASSGEAQTFPFTIHADGSSTFNNAPLLDASHPGAIVRSLTPAYANDPNVQVLTFTPEAAGTEVVLGIKQDGSFSPFSITTGGTRMACVAAGSTAPATSANLPAAIPGIAVALARTVTLDCGSDGPQTLTIASDGSAQLGSRAFSATAIDTVTDKLLFASDKQGRLKYLSSGTSDGGSTEDSLELSFDAGLQVLAAVADHQVGKSHSTLSCTP